MPTAKKPSDAARRRDTDRKFRWLEQIEADHELPHSAMLVAFEIMQGFNAEYGGAAWKSSQTMAENVGLSESGVIRIARRLVERGHLTVEPGKAGSGHSNRYFMVRKKTSTGRGFTAKKTSTGRGFKTSTGAEKTSTSRGDSLKTPLRQEAKASCHGEREREQALADDPGALAAGGAPREGFERLWALWSSHRNFPDTDEDEAAAWKAYVAIVPTEADPDELHARAEAQIAGIKANHLKVGDLWKWLVKNNWRKEPPPPRQARGRGKVSTAEWMRRQGEPSS